MFGEKPGKNLEELKFPSSSFVNNTVFFKHVLQPNVQSYDRRIEEKQTNVGERKDGQSRKKSQRWGRGRRSRSQWKVMFLFPFITWRLCIKDRGSSSPLLCCSNVFFMSINVSIITVAATQSTLIEQPNVRTCTRVKRTRAIGSGSSVRAKLGSQNCSDTEIITQATGVLNFRRKINRSCCERREIINR